MRSTGERFGIADFYPGSWAHDWPAAHTAAVVTLTPADAAEYFLLDQIIYSYEDIATDGELTIAEDGTVLFDIDTNEPGPAAVPLRDPYRSTPGATVVITLADGGTGIKGKLNVQYR